MSRFRLVDLAAQGVEVRRHTKGWPSSRILDWLRQQGEVVKIATPYDTFLYSFRSKEGIETGFRLTDAGELIIVGQHTMHPLS